MLLLAHKKCRKATPAFAYQRARPPGPPALRIENGWTWLCNDQIERLRTRSGLCETHEFCFFSHSYVGRRNEVSGGCVLELAVVGH